jgi:acetyl-CoA carboxylase biotin carboxyl carrier protein
VPLSEEDIREILRIVDESSVQELRIETEGFLLHVARGAAPAPTATVPGRSAAPGATLPAPHCEPAVEDGLVTVEAPLLGTFYRAEGPGSEPFVEVGSHVEPDTIICIIEVMKMMNSVPAGVRGRIAEVCQANSQLVEYGMALFRIEPA